MSALKTWWAGSPWMARWQAVPPAPPAPDLVGAAPPGRDRLPVRADRRGLHRRRRQRVHVRAPGARAQHRRRLLRAARPRLRGLLRDRRLHVRRRRVRAHQDPVVGLLDALSLPRAGPAGAGRGRDRCRPVPVLVLGDAGRGGARVRLLRRVLRRADPPSPRRLPGHRDARLRRDRAGGRAQLGLVHQRGPGHGRDPHAEAVRLRLRVRRRSRTTSWASAWWRSPCSSPSGSRSRGSGGRGWRSARTSWRRAPWG